MKPRTVALGVLLAGSLGGAAALWIGENLGEKGEPAPDVNVSIDVPVKIETAPTYAGPMTRTCALKDSQTNVEIEIRQVSS